MKITKNYIPYIITFLFIINPKLFAADVNTYTPNLSDINGDQFYQFQESFNILKEIDDSSLMRSGYGSQVYNSIISSTVIIPLVPPYSSITTVILLLFLIKILSTSLIKMVSGTKLIGIIIEPMVFGFLKSSNAWT